MNDTNSPIFQHRYKALLKDAESIFDLEWLRQETGALLMEALKTKRDEPWKAYVKWEDLCHHDAQLFFAAQFLKSYCAELEQVKAIVNEDVDAQTYRDEIDQLLWSFASQNLSNRWKPIKSDTDAAERTAAWQLSASVIYKCGKLGENVPQFLSLLNRIAILNDVIHGRALLHGIIYNKVYVRQITDPVEAFCEQAKTIISVIAETVNGQELVSNAKGKQTEYHPHVYSERFSLAMDEMCNSYPYEMKEYLGSKTKEQAESMTVVCPFIGMVLKLEKVCQPQVQKVDVAQALDAVYPGAKSAVQKLSAHEDIDKDEKLLRLFESVIDSLK